MDRRRFLKNACIVCAGAAATSMFLDSCSTTSHVLKVAAAGNELHVPLSEFQATNHLVVRTTSLDYDVFVNKNTNGEYQAMLLRCTHRDAPVRYTTGGLVCNEHGSRFGFEGKVTKEPATSNLSSFPVTVNETHLIIKIKSA